MAKCSAKSTALTSENVIASEPTSSSTNTQSRTSSSAATRARKTQTADEMATQRRRRSAVNSSAFLESFARSLCCAKTLPLSGQMRLGLGNDFDPNWNEWITRSSPFDCEPVALALTSGETACSCSLSYRSPNARDWKGMSAKKWRERERGDKTPTLPDQIGGVPHPEFVEQLLGFPVGWTDLRDLETASSRKLRNGSDDESLIQRMHGDEGDGA